MELYRRQQGSTVSWVCPQTFRSRWTTLFWWRKATPSRICLMSLFTSSSLKASSSRSDTHWLKISPPAALQHTIQKRSNILSGPLQWRGLHTVRDKHFLCNCRWGSRRKLRHQRQTQTTNCASSKTWPKWIWSLPRVLVFPGGSHKMQQK